jgi:DNA-directed RNA polymerase specialized sigma24 family protein
MSQPKEDPHFPTTSWTLIARIKSPDAAVARGALDEMCAQYHYPLYCYLRRRGCAHHDAQDVLHDFLAAILRQHALERVEETRGRLRSYLATALGRHLQRWRMHEARLAPEGRDCEAVDFDAVAARYAREQFTDHDTPDRIFERKWAMELLGHAMDKLAARYHERGKTALFTALRPALQAGGTLRGEDTPAIAASLGMSEMAVRTGMSRLLHEFREAVQDEVRMTVEESSEVGDELTYLLALFGK